ncbi:MAG: phenylacetate--CoA ligase [Deltaproteobacteria bacterium]|nr:phenylacetate--CoA ligase [Deltaproteobacteria bacterium]
MYWDRKTETISRDKLEELQLRRLKETVAKAADSPYYNALGLKDYRITTLSDIEKLPFTTKQDLREAYPYGMVCVPKQKLVRLHSSSGTTGTPTVVFHTIGDIDTWTDLVARCLYMIGVRKGDIFQNMIGYGLFTGGLGLHYGAELLGCLTIPTGPGNTKRQLRFMRDFEVSVVHVIPSYALHLADTAESLGVVPKRDLPRFRIAILGAEPHSEKTRKKVENFFGIRAFNSYGLAEMNGPGVAFECQEKQGMHIWEDAYLVEVINPHTLAHVKPGEIGELVLTTLTREGMPIIRYRTRDLTALMSGECACGRTHHRIKRISGRSDDMLIIKGVNIFPMQVEQVLMGKEGVGRNYQIILESRGHNDHMIVRVELDSNMFVGDLNKLEELKNRIIRDLRDEILITPEVELCEVGSLPISGGKAVRVVDAREI